MLARELFKKIKKTQTQFVGPLPIVKGVWDRLDIKKIIDDCCPTEAEAPISDSILTMVGNRLSSPEPLSCMEKWAKTSDIVSTLGVADVTYNDDRLGRALDAISHDAKSLWTQIMLKAATQFKFKTDSIFYDITSIYFEGDHKDSILLSHGYSRDGKPDKKQINLSLNCSQEGSIPVWYDIFKGNTNDQTTVVENMSKMDKLFKELSGKSTVVSRKFIGDRLMLNDRIAISYDQFSMKFVGTMDDSKAQDDLIRFVPDEILKSSPLDYKDKYKRRYFGVCIPHVFSHKETCMDETGAKHFILEAYVHVFFSESKYIFDQKKFDKKMAKTEEILEYIKSKLNNRKYSSREYVHFQLQNKLKGKSGRFFFDYEVQGEDGSLTLSWKRKEQKIKETQALFGKYGIYTNDRLLSSETVLRDYKDKDKVEKSFSGLKGPFKIRPVFLQNDSRIEALVFVILLSYLIFSLIRLACERHKFKISEKTFIRIFKSLNSVKIVMIDGSFLIQTDPLTEKQNKIFHCLGLQPP